MEAKSSGNTSKMVDKSTNNFFNVSKNIEHS